MKEWSRVIFTSLLGMKIKSHMTLKEDFETEKYIHIIQGPHVADILCKMEKLMGREFCYVLVIFRNCKDHTYSELTDRYMYKKNYNVMRLNV